MQRTASPTDCHKTGNCMMTWEKAVTTGPLDRHVLELQRREDRDTEEGHTNDGSDINYLPCSELRLEEGLGKRDMINDGSDIDYLPCSELSLDEGLGSSCYGEHSVRGGLET